MLYGLFGLPLLLLSVARLGRKLAKLSLNGLLIIRHYFFSLPVHYLCCACNPFLCCRWLSWCCCCCCCSYLCCSICKNKNDAKCCDIGKAPKLSLRLRPKDGATAAAKQHNLSGAAQIAQRQTLQGKSKQTTENSMKLCN